MNRKQQLGLIEYLEGFTTPDRVDRIARVLEDRTRWITVVLEDIYQPRNASAVLRSCDCFGIQDLHVIENRNRFDPDSVISSGSDRWISIRRYKDTGGNNTLRCFNELRSAGYAVVAMTPHDKGVPVDKLPVDRKTALVFGTELEGLSDYTMTHADGYATIPMYGFSESFNISVSAALTLYDLVSRLRKSDVEWRLGEEEKRVLTVEWLKKSIRAGDRLVEKFLANGD